MNLWTLCRSSNPRTYVVSGHFPLFSLPNVYRAAVISQEPLGKVKIKWACYTNCCRGENVRIMMIPIRKCKSNNKRNGGRPI